MTAGGIHAAGAIDIEATPTGSTSPNTLSTPSSLGSAEQAGKADTTPIHPPAESDSSLVVSERRISVDKMEEEQDAHPGFTLVKPPKSSPELKSDPSKCTLGKLFTDGGLEDILVGILSVSGMKDLWSCLNLCKNTNAVMVKDSKVQLFLRAYLYGVGALPIPIQYRSKPSAAGKAQSFQSTVDFIVNMQRQNEDCYWEKTKSDPLNMGPHESIDIQGNDILLVFEDDWAVFSALDAFRWGARDSEVSVVTLGAGDMVVVEASVHQVRRPAGVERLVRFKFTSPQLRAGSPGSSKHPKAKAERVMLYLAQPTVADFEQDAIKVRLYPGGLVAVLLVDDHECGLSCSDSASLFTRLVVWDWYQCAGLGVVKLLDHTVRILDFYFLNDLQIICSCVRSIDGDTYPCIEIYNIPQSRHPSEGPEIRITSSETSSWPSMHLSASFRFPRLQPTQLGCVWARPSESSYITKFDLRVQSPSIYNVLTDQVMTFRIKGKVKNKSERLQGVVLLSKLRRIAVDGLKALGAGSSTVDVPGFPSASIEDPIQRESAINNEPPSRRQSLHVDWNSWSSAVALQHSNSSTVLQPKRTSVASLARSRKDKTHAVMIIRDYSQRLLVAPSGHLERNLGHPTENGGPSDPVSINDKSKFKPVTEPRSIDSCLFGGSVKYGLDHRIRMVDIGEYSPKTATSKVFWDGSLMFIFPQLPNEELGMHHYRLVCPSSNLDAQTVKEGVSPETDQK